MEFNSGFKGLNHNTEDTPLLRDVNKQQLRRIWC